MKKHFFFLSFVAFFWRAEAQRNVVLIIADDLGYDWCGFNDSHKDTCTLPNVRRLLAKGVRFRNATAGPVCSNTRAGILTGRYNFRTGVGSVVGGSGGSGELDTSEITIPKLLKVYDPSIKKSCIGKWHLHRDTSIKYLYPLKCGYDHYEGVFGGLVNNYSFWKKVKNGSSTMMNSYVTIEIVNNALSWIRAQGNSPFFTCVTFNAPHTPYHVPPLTHYTGPPLPGTGADILANPTNYYKALTEAMDTEIGRMLDSLQAMNKTDSTYFIFIGDNGNPIQVMQNGGTFCKGSVYEYGTHVPFIISGPGIASPGRTSQALVNTVDLFATTLELMGYANWSAQIPVNKPVDSKSLLPLLKNTSTSVRPWAFSEIFKNTPDSADGKGMRNMNYKLIRFDHGVERFFNLAVDTNEFVDLLKTTMSTTDITNYYYLCNEMKMLVGSGNFCINGIDEIATKDDRLVFYPDPASDKITINNEQEGTLYIYDPRGSLVRTITLNSSGQSVDCSELSEGLYHLLFRDKGKILSKNKMVISR